MLETRLIYRHKVSAYVVGAVPVNPAFLVDHHVVVIHMERCGLVVVLHRHPHPSSVRLRRYPGIVRNLDAHADPTTAVQAGLTTQWSEQVLSGSGYSENVQYVSRGVESLDLHVWRVVLHCPRCIC